MDKELFKKLENSEIWELRTLFNGICYRLFAFWDNEINALVMVTHGIVKKTQKTPKKEIEKAERIRQEYFNDKKNKSYGKDEFHTSGRYERRALGANRHSRA